MLLHFSFAGTLPPPSYPPPLHQVSKFLVFSDLREASAIKFFVFRTLGSAGHENKGVKNLLETPCRDFKGSGRGSMNSRIQGVVPQGLKPTLSFEALCRPATHPLGGFPGRALLQNLACSEFFRNLLRGIQGGWTGITLLRVLEFEIRIERRGQILRKKRACAGGLK